MRSIETHFLSYKPQGNMGHLAASRCPACESGIWIILLLSLFKKFLQKLGNVLDGAREFL